MLGVDGCLWVGGWWGKYYACAAAVDRSIICSPTLSYPTPHRDGLTLDRFVVEHRDLAEAIEGTRQKLDPTALRRVRKDEWE